ncbi:MAG: DNA topoisomerase III [Pelotomaculum sp. PtaB.Bin104]|nr:MAG: DNA topoisomerase III [Pelotomaculum sp. PtaB.Bin104]
MRCPTCCKTVTQTEKSYQCDCVKVPKELLGKKITPEIVHELLNNRRTGILEGFMSRRNGKPFSAALIIKDGEVKFNFGEKESSGTVRIRVHSGNSGSVHISLTGAVNKDFEINYGHVSSRMAECLGCITAANFIKHQVPDSTKIKLDISLNNLDFSRYILRERIPRDKEIKAALEYLFGILSGFAGWQAQFKPKKRPRLQGSPQSNNFPKGIFPWLKLNISEHDISISVKLPESPDVKAQFKASLQKATEGDENTYSLPKTAKPALIAWLNSVNKSS